MVVQLSTMSYLHPENYFTTGIKQFQDYMFSTAPDLLCLARLILARAYSNYIRNLPAQS